MQVQAPPAEGAALRHDHAVGSAVGHHDLGRRRMRLVLEHHHGVLGQAPHPAEQQL